MIDYKREAERLRIVLQTFAHAHPGMTLDEAAPLIFEAEKRAAELESPRISTTDAAIFTLPDTQPRTVALWIELHPHVQDMIRDRTKINAIKEVRAKTLIGLKEAKEGVEFWEKHMGILGSAGPGSGLPSLSLTPHALAGWIDAHERIVDVLRSSDPNRKIHAIREVRLTHPSSPGLHEAKEAVEFWQDHFE